MLFTYFALTSERVWFIIVKDPLRAVRSFCPFPACAGEERRITPPLRAGKGKVRKMRYSVYLFDLDGTLCDTGEGIIKAAGYALERLGEPMPDSGTMRKFIGPPLWDCFEKVVGLDSEKTGRAVKLYREYYAEKGLYENRLYEGVEETLRTPKEGCAVLGVATCKPEPFSVKILENHGIAGYFQSITGSLTDGGRREKEEVINCVLERIGCDDIGSRRKAVMVGDRKYDLIGARKTGLQSIGVLYGYGSLEELREYGAEHLVNRPEEIPAV